MKCINQCVELCIFHEAINSLHFLLRTFILSPICKIVLFLNPFQSIKFCKVISSYFCAMGPAIVRPAQVPAVHRGIGLSRRDRKRIFERFHRVEDELTRKTSGTGLGLTLARDLVRGFGGKIQVKSKLGEGSRFTKVLTSGGKI